MLGLPTAFKGAPDEKSLAAVDVLAGLSPTEIAAVIGHGTARTRFFEPLAIGSAALVLGAAPGGDERRNRLLERAGRLLFAFALVIFGIQHFLYAEFLAMLVPAWLPGHLAFIYFTGASFIAAGIAIGTNVFARFAAGCLGLMFFLWVVALHAPRVAAAPANYAELASLFIALAMCGSGWLLVTPSTAARS